jgi:hypothetical protein
VFRGHRVTSTVAVAHGAPADDFSGRPGRKFGLATVASDGFMSKRSIAVLVDGKVPDGNSGTTDSQST